jgi:transposase
MLYLAIDQHRKQLTVNLRNEAGDVLVKRQVSTEWTRVREFLEEVRARSVPDGGFVAILEVCGFNDWLLKLLAEYGCRETVLVQPEKRSKKKTDRRDANALGEILWVNRQRLLAGQRVQGVRRVNLPAEQEAENRQLTVLRQRLGQLRTRTINKVKHLLRKHNLEQQQPAKGIDTKRTRKWLAELVLGEIDRLEMDQLLAQWKLWDEQIKDLDAKIQERQQTDKTAAVVATIPGCAAYSSLALASRIGAIERFPRPSSLANLLGTDARLPQFRRGDRSARSPNKAAPWPALSSDIPWRERTNDSPRHPCGSFAGLLPTSRGRGPSPCTPYPLLRSNRTLANDPHEASTQSTSAQEQNKTTNARIRISVASALLRSKKRPSPATPV